MTCAIKARLVDAVKDALKKGRKQEVGALRLILAAIQQHEVDSRTEVDDATTLTILGKLAKQRRESISQYEKAGRNDLVAQETFELDLLRSYLPEPLDDADIDKAIGEAIATAAAESPRDMGKVMGLLKASLQGRADLGVVSARVKTRLSGGDDAA
ncbi:MAG: GatB/YqeY domain-containing protein [Gammaproteobacteria bacterium]|nr:GatB/YqeY domain-containing protein [Gammaproteobacteria bacterium]